MRPPHRFPFELVDRTGGGTADVAATAGAWWLRGETPLTLPWLVEAVAQAAARLLPRAPGAGELALVAIDEAVLERPVEPGERVELAARWSGRVGELVLVEGEVRAGDAVLGRLRLALAATPLGEPLQPRASRASRS